MAGDRRDKDRRIDSKPVQQERRKGQRRQGERRKFVRVAVEVWVDQYWGSEHCGRRTADLSVGGAQFDLGLPHEIGTRLKIRFCLPGEDHVFEIESEVVAADMSIDQPITNLRFVNLNDEDRARIAHFLEKYGDD